MFEYGQNRWSDNFDEYRPIGRDDAMGYLESWRSAMIEHYRRLSLLVEPEETLTPEQEIDFTTAEWEVLAI